MTHGSSPGRDTLPAQHQAGVCLHLTSLPGEFGIGEIGAAARRFIDAMVRMNLRVWQILPTGPTGYGDSPYQPLSTFAGNEMLIDVSTLVSERLLKSNEADALLGLSAGLVDYDALIPRKTALLELAASRFTSNASSQMKVAFDDFVERQDQAWLHDYALFRILKKQHGLKPWTEWEAPFAHRDEAALRKLQAAARRQLEYCKILQFLFHRQWQQLRQYADERGVTLFGDLPMYIAMDSADAWSHREILRLKRNGRPGLVAGVPPDYFSANGQLWGNPVYNWDRIAADGYRWWIDRMRHYTTMTDLVRIDHFRGFAAYWAVPSRNSTARKGEWLPGPGDAVFNAMRDALGRLPIVAEDLGQITEDVLALRNRQHFPGMRVLQFEVGQPTFDISSIGEHCVCYTGTHDNDTTIGWFRGSPPDKRSAAEILQMQERVLERTNGQPATIHHDLIRLAFSSAARLAIAPIQDYLGLGSEARLNTPGAAANNWRWRLRLEQLQPALFDAVGAIVDVSGRANSA